MPDIYQIRLRSCGNPDKGQTEPQSEPMLVTAPSLWQLLAAAEDYKADNNLGAGNWPQIKVVKNGRVWATLAFNGKVFGLDGREVKVS